MPSLLTYWRTVRYLKPVQVYGRIWFHLARRRVDLRGAPALRPLQNQRWVTPARRRRSLIGPERFCFLHEMHDLKDAGWDSPTLEKLWRYNIHYFDDLNAQCADDRHDWHRALLSRWVCENPPALGTGWEPYPTSLRIVNWIKWALVGNRLPSECIHSLAVQVRWLSQRLEIHLLGNHLFANAKALVFAGAFFQGAESEKWFEQGLQIVDREVSEQVLPDGGHFERSPMYHSLALEDMLDLLNLSAVCTENARGHWRRFSASLPELLSRMQNWLAAMCHPDGEPSFFNDAAIGIAPSPAELGSYAVRLGLPSLAAPHDGVTHLRESGYIRVQRNNMVALLDVAPVGPDYLPGHAHADTLSFELSLYGRRVLVNSGTSCYGAGSERLRQRGTAAHNTVAIDGQNSSEVWGGFRVARRAKPFGLQIQEDTTGVRVVCSQNGYMRLPGRPIHRREWRFSSSVLDLIDTVEGSYGEAVGRLFVFPGLAASTVPGSHTGFIRLDDRRSLRWVADGAMVEQMPSTYHPEFGLAVANSCLVLRFTASRCHIRFTWN